MRPEAPAPAGDLDPQAPKARRTEDEEFVCAVSHELRSPIGALLVFGNLLAKDCGGQLDEHGQDLLRRIDDAARRTVVLMDRLVLHARILRQPMAPARLDMTSEVRSVFAEQTRARDDAPVTLELGVVPDAHADPALMRLLLCNLIDNAVRFSAGRRDARIEVQGTAGADELTWSVRDNGIGFDPDLAPRLFTPFGRLHAQADYPGSGLGLAIVRRIAQRHGGRVWAEAPPGGGALFSVALPRQAPQAGGAAAPAE